MHETPGVTRDRKELVCDWNGKRFLLIDTGGVDDRATDAVQPARSPSRRAPAIEEADLVLFVVDARPGSRRATRSSPRSCARRTSRCSCSRTRSTTRAATSRRSSSTGSGSATRCRSRRCTATAPATCSTRSSSGCRARGRAQVGEEAIRVAILGRPNVGKSSLLNALSAQERVIVSEVPGTTRDAIDTVLRARRARRSCSSTRPACGASASQRQGIEYYSELRALEAAERADVALVLVDASEGIVEQDLAVADVARKAGCSTLVVLSKWDDDADRRSRTCGRSSRRRLRQRPPLIAVSAKTGRGLDRLLDHVEELFAKHTGADPDARR